MRLHARFAAGLAAAIAGSAVCGCPEPEPTTQPVATSRPAAVAPAPETPPSPTPDPHQRVEVRVRRLTDPQDGWLRIEAIRTDAPGAWATGEFLQEDNKIVIETEDVDRFSIRLPELHADWDHRVVLRIDGHSSELKRKRHPILHLHRTPTGAWEVVEP